MAQQQNSATPLDMANSVLGSFARFSAGPSLGTADAPRQPEPARPSVQLRHENCRPIWCDDCGRAMTNCPHQHAESSRPSTIHGIVQDEQAIAAGRRDRRERLAMRRAEQQVRILMAEAARLGIELSVAQITAVAIDTYTACIAVARR